MLARSGRGIAWLAAGALVAAELGAAASTKAHTFSATLTAAQESSTYSVKAARARGSFSGSYVTHGISATLTWQLRYSHLTGRAVAAQIRLGKRGVSGKVLVGLCAASCRSGLGGTTRITATIAAEIDAGATYVNVVTAKNPRGEIRGQITPGA